MFDLASQGKTAVVYSDEKEGESSPTIYENVRKDMPLRQTKYQMRGNYISI